MYLEYSNGNPIEAQGCCFLIVWSHVHFILVYIVINGWWRLKYWLKIEMLGYSLSWSFRINKIYSYDTYSAVFCWCGCKLKTGLKVIPFTLWIPLSPPAKKRSTVCIYIVRRWLGHKVQEKGSTSFIDLYCIACWCQILLLYSLCFRIKTKYFTLCYFIYISLFTDYLLGPHFKWVSCQHSVVQVQDCIWRIRHPDI